MKVKESVLYIRSTKSKKIESLRAIEGKKKKQKNQIVFFYYCHLY